MSCLFWLEPASKSTHYKEPLQPWRYLGLLEQRNGKIKNNVCVGVSSLERNDKIAIGSRWFVVDSLKENRCLNLASMHLFPLFQQMLRSSDYRFPSVWDVWVYVNRNYSIWREWKEKAHASTLNSLSFRNLFSSFIDTRNYCLFLVTC